MNQNAALIALTIATCLLFTTQSVAARPCKSIFISSYYSFSIKPLSNPNPNPNPNPGFVAVFAEITTQNPPFHTDGSSATIIIDRPSLSSYRRLPRHLHHNDLKSYDMSSLRDRTKDILSVVVALLFGVGCGALTAATMYLIWSLFSCRYYGDILDDESDEEEDDIAAAKKMGYVKIHEVENVKHAKEVSGAF